MGLLKLRIRGRPELSGSNIEVKQAVREALDEGKKPIEMGLFYVSTSGELIPAVIQLHKMIEDIVENG